MRRALVLALVLAAAVGVGVVAIRPRPEAPSAPAPARRPAPDMEIVFYAADGRDPDPPAALSALWVRAPVVLNFWAALCPPCRAEMPDFQRLYQTHRPGRYLLVGVDVGPFIGLGSREEGQALRRQLGVTYPTGTTFDGHVVRAFGVVGMPTTVFIATDGTIVRHHTGLLTLAQMRAFTDELLSLSGAR